MSNIDVTACDSCSDVGPELELIAAPNPAQFPPSGVVSASASACASSTFSSEFESSGVSAMVRCLPPKGAGYCPLAASEPMDHPLDALDRPEAEIGGHPDHQELEVPGRPGRRPEGTAARRARPVGL